MAPVPTEPEIRYAGAATVALHFLSVAYLTLQVGSSLYQSSRALSPAQNVRLRLDTRKKLVPMFSSLAALALVAATWSAWKYTSLSFQVWADQRGPVDNVQQPLATNSSSSAPRATDLVLERVRWLSDTPLYQDAFEIVAEKARRFWWGRQIDLALVPWSTFLALEGTRRRISHLLAFLSLAHLVSLSYAQNLFFVALLLTPAPLPGDGPHPPPSRWTRAVNAVFPPKPPGWALGPGFYLLSVLASYGTAFLVPSVAETPALGRVVATSRALTFAPLVLQTVAPASWGAVHTHHHEASAAFTDLFRFMCVVSVALHGTATFTGLKYNVPHAHYHRHSKLLPWDIEERSRWERTTTAVGKLLGATSDHPVVAAVGCDVLLSGLSTGLWAAVRSLRAGDILRSVVPLYGDTAAVKTNDQEGTNKRQEPPTPRRRGRPRKVSRQDPVEEPGDKTYAPTPGEEGSAEGDALPRQPMDWDAAGLVWGLMAIGGLGLGCAGVFGGESLAR